MTLNERGLGHPDPGHAMALPHHRHQEGDRHRDHPKSHADRGSPLSLGDTGCVAAVLWPDRDEHQLERRSETGLTAVAQGQTGYPEPESGQREATHDHDIDEGSFGHKPQE